MTVKELIEKLTDIQEKYGGDLNVRYPDYEKGGHEDVDYIMEVGRDGTENIVKPTWIKLY